MKYSRLLTIILLLGLACTSYVANKEGRQPSSDNLSLVRELKPVLVIGEGQLGTSVLSYPVGIALDILGNVFITDTGNDRVVECNPQGEFLKEIGGFGWGNGQFNRPTYITTDNGLNIYVVDTQNKRIQRMDHNLNFVSSIQVEQEGDFTGIGLPEGIAVTSSGEIILSDISGDRIIMLDDIFKYKRSFGGFGGGGGNLNDPLGVFVDREGNIFVADSHDNRIAVFDQFGNYFKGFGEKYLNIPSAVTVSQDQLVWVANTGNNSIAVFNPQGSLVSEYGDLGTGGLNLSKPTDVKFGPNGRLYVVDSGNNRVVVFELAR